jgi:hypothetical protein
MMRKVQEKFADAEFAKKFHGIATVTWFVVSAPLAFLFGDQVIFVTWLSLYAIVVAHWSSWQATRTEILQADAEKKQQEDHERLKKLDPDHPRNGVDTKAPDDPPLGVR